MPIVDFEDIQFENRDLKTNLMHEVQVWVSGIKELEVGPEHVVPGIKEVMRLEPGKIIVIYVQELFTESMSGKLRDAETRKKIIQIIKTGFNHFIASHEDEFVDDVEQAVDQPYINIRPREVVVVIRMVDRNEGEYDSWTVPAPSEK